MPILYGCEIARSSGGTVGELFNGAALASADRGPSDWYGKQRLLPFLEGVPFARWIGWNPAAARRRKEDRRSYLTLAGNFSPGPRPVVFEVGPARIGMLICYEAFHPDLVRRCRLAGANALCVITNDSWWGRSAFAPWHARMVFSRAREADIPVVRAANSGISSLTDRLGRMGRATTISEVTTLRAALELSPSAPTFYERRRELFIWAELAAVALLAVAFRRRPGKSAAPARRRWLPASAGLTVPSPGVARPRRKPGPGHRRA